MKELFRATVMLAVLVGLPSAWIYYGPLPPSAQQAVDRVVEVVKDATGWQQPYEETVAPKTAPRYAAAPAAAEPISFAAAPAAQPAPAAAPANLDQQLQPLLEQLQSLGATEYSLEEWGNEGGLYRFCCEMPLGAQAGFTQQFEAVGSGPAECVVKVTAEVSRWKRTRTQPPIAPAQLASTRAMVR